MRSIIRSLLSSVTRRRDGRALRTWRTAQRTECSPASAAAAPTTFARFRARCSCASHAASTRRLERQQWSPTRGCASQGAGRGCWRAAALLLTLSQHAGCSTPFSVAQRADSPSSTARRSSTPSPRICALAFGRSWSAPTRWAASCAAMALHPRRPMVPPLRRISLLDREVLRATRCALCVPRRSEVDPPTLRIALRCSLSVRCGEATCRVAS